MSSSGLTRTSPMTIWCFLILFVSLFSLTTSFTCYTCDSDCDTTQKEEDCGGDPGAGKIRLCNAQFDGNKKVQSKGCGEADAGTKDECNASGKACACINELCNDWKELPKIEKGSGSGSGTGGGPTPWNNLLWIGMICANTILMY